MVNGYNIRVRVDEIMEIVDSGWSPVPVGFGSLVLGLGLRCGLC